MITLAVRRGRWLAFVIVLVVLGPALLAPLAGAVEPPAGEQAAARYHPETGFWVDPLFNDFWERNGGLMTFGYPLTRVFYQDGLHRQYFERAIFEHHEDAAGSAWAVQLVRLGAFNTIERRKHEPIFQSRAHDPELDRDLLYFPETGHALGAAFRPYWERHGAIQAFGYPLSDPFVEPSIEDGVPRLVQYFERARFEYHEELAGTPFEILLGHLGREALAAREVPPIAVTPQQPTPEDRDAPPLGPLPVGMPHVPACGFNAAFWGGDEYRERNLRYLDLAKDSGCRWLRLYFSWEGIEPNAPGEVDARVWPYVWIVRRAHERGLKVLVYLAQPPAWSRPADRSLPADPEAMAAFLQRLVPFFEGQVNAWQVLNEPNLAADRSERIDPYGYFQVLKAAYPAIKRSDPEALVVFPGLAPTSIMDPHWAIDDDWYLEAILGINHGEIASYFDVLGMQAYGAGNSPDSYYPGNLAGNPEWVTAPEFYFRHVEQLRAVMVNAGLASTPVWITETGWPVGRKNDMYGYGEYITRELQAQYLTRAFEIVRTELQWVDLVLVWHLNTAAFEDDGAGFSGFSLVDGAGYPRPAYDQIRALVAGWQE